jgi:hypothetical protein
MAAPLSGGKLYHLFTLICDAGMAGNVAGVAEEAGMIGLALAMFIALFGFGAQYFGWQDPVGKVQLALFTSFILGVVCGYKSKG